MYYNGVFETTYCLPVYYVLFSNILLHYFVDQQYIMRLRLPCPALLQLLYIKMRRSGHWRTDSGIIDIFLWFKLNENIRIFFITFIFLIFRYVWFWNLNIFICFYFSDKMSGMSQCVDFLMFQRALKQQRCRVQLINLGGRLRKIYWNVGDNQMNTVHLN